MPSWSLAFDTTMNLTKNCIGSALACLGLVFAGCSSGGDTAGLAPGGDFVLLRVTPPNNASLYLNDAIQFDFSHAVDLSTADLNSVSFNVFDLTGTPLGEQPRGSFRVTASPGDAAAGRRLEFVPVLPSNDLLDNGGFKAARRYVVQLVGGDRRNGVVLRDVRGRELATPVSFSFTTVDGVTAGELFRNTKQGGPRRAGFQVTPSVLNSAGVRMVDPNFNAASRLEVRLDFDQPVNPQSANIPANVDLDPRTRDSRSKGRVFLEYDDSALGGEDTWIPAEVELVSNSIEGATVILRPLGVLPNNATIDVRVLNTFEDLAGESNIGDAAYNSLFGQFVVEARHEPQFDAFVERFEGLGAVDLETPFVEPVAEIEDGALRAALAFEGQNSTIDYEPAQPGETILNTDFTRVSLRSGRTLNVSGGVFQFRNVNIPAGYTVKGEGTKPMVWLVTGDMNIHGVLRVDGERGEEVFSTSAELPSAGGAGQCGGGRGGRGSVITTGRTERAENGFGPDQVTNGGGEGGLHSCLAATGTNCRIGSGGGGGAFATKGDPDFYTLFQRFRGTGTGEFDMIRGDGRVGCQNKPEGQPGVTAGSAGPLGFRDADRNNDFVGTAIRFASGLPSARLAGELAAPRGGSGGGGGGDAAAPCDTVTNWRTDAKGGGGGGGAGILIIKCLGQLRIGSGGLISANGGHGGGGHPNGTSAAGSNTTAGAGGGGGSGGMVIIMASWVHIVRHGEAYGDALTTTRAAGAYSFAITADGGVGRRNPQVGLMPIRGKYPTSFLAGEPCETGSSWIATIGDRPVGGFGGNGVVQLMTPSRGDDDATGSFFDDSIAFYATDADLAAGTKLPAATKKALLGWRGYVNDAGERRDDRNALITISQNGFNIGDIKPAPVLLPVPFGPKSRAVSEPVDLGRVDRVESSVAQGVRTIVPRGTATGDPFTNLLAGPTFVFDGAEWVASRGADQAYQGYLQFDAAGLQSVTVVSGSRSEVARVAANAKFNNRDAHRVDLTTSNAVLAQIPGRYTGYLAQLLDASGNIMAERRVLGHDGNVLYLDPAGAVLPAAPVTAVQLAGKFATVETNGVSGLGPVVGNGAVRWPGANVRIGFAFYRDARDPATRSPATGFHYDVNTANTARIVDLRGQRIRYVQYDILFNTLFTPIRDVNNVDNIDATRLLSPAVARPVLRELVLPFQF